MSNTLKTKLKNTKKIILSICVSAIIIFGISVFTVLNNNPIIKKSNALSIQTPYVITNKDIGIGTFTPNTVQQGQKVNCTFPLTGSPTGIYNIPKEGFKADISSSLSDSCTVAVTILTCSNIPTNSSGRSGSIRLISVNIQNSTQYFRNKAYVTLTANGVCANKTVNAPVCTICPYNYTFVNSTCVFKQDTSPYYIIRISSGA